MGRARRREDSKRMKAKARKIYPHDQEATLADHLAQCSCVGCGNARRHKGEVTRAEEKAELKLKEELNDEIPNRMPGSDGGTGL